MVSVLPQKSINLDSIFGHAIFKTQKFGLLCNWLKKSHLLNGLPDRKEDRYETNHKIDPHGINSCDSHGCSRLFDCVYNGLDISDGLPKAQAALGYDHPPIPESDSKGVIKNGRTNGYRTGFS